MAKLAQQTGQDFMADYAVASQIPADYFQQPSRIALEDSNNFQEVEYNPPDFEPDTNYYSKFWGSFLDNEKVLNEIQDVANDNQQIVNQIYNLEDFYDNNLLPKMFAFPH